MVINSQTDRQRNFGKKSCISSLGYNLRVTELAFDVLPVSDVVFYVPSTHLNANFNVKASIFSVGYFATVI